MATRRKFKILIFCEDDNLGPSIPVISIAREIKKNRKEIEILFVSYGTAAKFIKLFGFPLKKLSSPFEKGNIKTKKMIPDSCMKIIKNFKPDLVLISWFWRILNSIPKERKYKVISIFGEPIRNNHTDEWFRKFYKISDYIILRFDEKYWDPPEKYKKEGKLFFSGPITLISSDTLNNKRDIITISCSGGGWKRSPWKNVSEKILMASLKIINRYRNEKFFVSVGLGIPRTLLVKFKKRIKNRNVKIVEYVHPIDFLRILGRSKIAVLRAGNVAFESCLLRVPCLLIPALDEQIYRAKKIEGFGCGKMILPENLDEQLERSFSKLLENQQKFRKNQKKYFSNPRNVTRTSSFILKLINDKKNYR